jgi:8-oxo-dGTP pyrophosphatase MutT (NUDIX family)
MKKIYCNNCGSSKHIYKKCPNPVASYGIICLDYDNNKKEFNYLMINRKHSLNFVEFIRGKYNLKQIDYIVKLFDHMTIEEKQLIINNNFDELWEKVWQNNKYSKNDPRSDYKRGELKFNILKSGYTIINKNEEEEHIDLDNILSKVTCHFSETEWGFPKGKRNYHESNRKCAKREFMEETNLKYKDFHLLENVPTIEELHMGSNNKQYKTVYFFAIFKKKNKELRVNSFNRFQRNEVNRLGWYSFNEASLLFRNYEIYKYKIIEDIKKHINEFKIEKYIENK